MDLVIGQGYQHSDLYWYRQPSDPRDPWDQHLITDRFQKYHDLTVGDVDNDGQPELVGLSQEAESLFYYDIPDDPFVEMWPDSACTIVDDTISAEGIHVGDVDGDGSSEIVAGTSLYHFDNGEWVREQYADGWDDVRVAVADLDGDGADEIIVSEGDSPTYGTHPGRVAWFDPPEWESHLLANDLFCPHSLQIADFTGNGWPDIFVGEMGLGENRSPIHSVYVNNGDRTFDPWIISRGIPTHEAKAVDINGDRPIDIARKSYGPTHHVDIWYNSLSTTPHDRPPQ